MNYFNWNRFETSSCQLERSCTFLIYYLRAYAEVIRKSRSLFWYPEVVLN